MIQEVENSYNNHKWIETRYYLKEGDRFYCNGATLQKTVENYILVSADDDMFYNGLPVEEDEQGRMYVVIKEKDI